MPNQEFHLNIGYKLNSLSDAEKEIGQLKMVIGFMLAKLQPHDRQAVIQELQIPLYRDPPILFPSCGSPTHYRKETHRPPAATQKQSGNRVSSLTPLTDFTLNLAPGH